MIEARAYMCDHLRVCAPTLDGQFIHADNGSICGALSGYKDLDDAIVRQHEVKLAVTEGDRYKRLDGPI